MANNICATCRYYVADGNGKGYCQCHDTKVSHGSCCCDYEED